ncbi:hypothetical protein EG68_09523 [Paragonimus skrjabini miyazakii]|uniref:Uncharacterized protein n=1 Tax=Paragonimus skrjabini miyazakii TaxID=59628 RepID=A0A8S9YC00_9TREM|nr:hypothetical protein EG68_09523 [Paragonimus skrjabini miyazakii]
MFLCNFVSWFLFPWLSTFIKEDWMGCGERSISVRTGLSQKGIGNGFLSHENNIIPMHVQIN